MKDERRTSERIRYVVEVELDGLLRAKLVDLSPEGAFIESRTAFTPGAVVQLRFSVLGREVETAAEIRHSCRGIGMGVKFIGLDPLARAEIAQLLARSEQSSEPSASRRWPRVGEKVATVCPECEWHRAAVAVAANTPDGPIYLRCGACPASWPVPARALVPLDDNPSGPWRLA